ncbi:hypothetical protein MTO96_035879 [Rhipicephalus appendiculatus]
MLPGILAVMIMLALPMTRECISHVDAEINPQCEKRACNESGICEPPCRCYLLQKVKYMCLALEWRSDN